MAWLSDLVDSYLDRCGITGRAVSRLFRQGTATLTLDNGAELRSIQMRLGHAKIETVTMYTQVANARL